MRQGATGATDRWLTTDQPPPPVRRLNRRPLLLLLLGLGALPLAALSLLGTQGTWPFQAARYPSRLRGRRGRSQAAPCKQARQPAPGGRSAPTACAARNPEGVHAWGGGQGQQAACQGRMQARAEADACSAASTCLAASPASNPSRHTEQSLLCRAAMPSAVRRVQGSAAIWAASSPPGGGCPAAGGGARRTEQRQPGRQAAAAPASLAHALASQPSHSALLRQHSPPKAS